MAGKPKRTAEYFPHHVSSTVVDILHEQFGINGYAAYYRLREKLSESEGHFYDARSNISLMHLATKCYVSKDDLIKIIDVLVEMGQIDAKLWSNRIIWDKHFVESLAPLYVNRSYGSGKTAIPTITDVYEYTGISYEKNEAIETIVDEIGGVMAVIDQYIEASGFKNKAEKRQQLLIEYHENKEIFDVWLRKMAVIPSLEKAIPSLEMKIKHHSYPRNATNKSKVKESKVKESKLKSKLKVNMSETDSQLETHFLGLEEEIKTAVRLYEDGFEFNEIFKCISRRDVFLDAIVTLRDPKNTPEKYRSFLNSRLKEISDKKNSFELIKLCKQLLCSDKIIGTRKQKIEMMKAEESKKAQTESDRKAKELNDRNEKIATAYFESLDKRSQADYRRLALQEIGHGKHRFIYDATIRNLIKIDHPELFDSS